jgi:cytochrome c553
MKNVAAFYASKQAKPGFAKNKDRGLLGEKIYRGGIAEKRRCRPAPAATAPPAPASRPSTRASGGQHADYTELQLVAFRSGARQHAQMSIAAKMSDREIKAVSDYIAGLR